jgi:hypothetical protein
MHLRQVRVLPMSRDSNGGYVFRHRALAAAKAKRKPRSDALRLAVTT